MNAAIKVSTATANARPVVMTHFVGLAHGTVDDKKHCTYAELLAEQGVTLEADPEKVFQLQPSTRGERHLHLSACD